MKEEGDGERVPYHTYTHIKAHARAHVRTRTREHAHVCHDMHMTIIFHFDTGLSYRKFRVHGSVSFLRRKCFP